MDQPIIDLLLFHLRPLLSIQKCIDNSWRFLERSIIDPLSIQSVQKLSIQKEAKKEADGGFATAKIPWIDNRYRSIIDPRKFQNYRYKFVSIIFLDL